MNKRGQKSKKKDKKLGTGNSLVNFVAQKKFFDAKVDYIITTNIFTIIS